VSPTAVQKYGKDYPLHPVGTGPFVFHEWIKDNKVTLKRSETYWQKAPDGSQLPYLDELVMRSIIDDSVRLIELQTNNIQIMETVPPKDVATIQNNPALAYVKLDGLPYHYRLNFNTTKAPFDNKVLRQAFCWAVNRETMVRVLAFGQGVPSKSVWPAGSWMADANANAYGYDPEKAKALFKESGVTSLEFPIVVFTRDEDQLLGQMLQSQLQEVGVKLTIESVERSSGVERYRSGDFLMGIGRFSTEGDPDLQINQFLGKTANNYWTNYDSAAFNDLRNKAAGTYDVAQRKAFYTDLDKVLLGDAPAVELYKRDWAHALSTKIQGFETTARGMWVLTSAWLER
jgi:peptide/nickel transport system substrate-binding protein